VPAIPVAAPAPVLGYAGPTVPQRPAFNARRTWTWKGDHLFRVYLTGNRVYFVRIGGGKTHETVALTQFGLLGGLVAWYLSKQRKKKEARTVLRNEEKPIDQLMAEHKLNHAYAASDLADVAVDAGGVWTGRRVTWTFRVPGEKRPVSCVLEKPEDVESAVNRLPHLFPAMRIGVVYDEKRHRWVKRKP
jgi:hypothetical protein